MRTGFTGSEMSSRMPLPAHAPAASPISGIRGDVVALVRHRGALRARPVIAAGQSPAIAPVSMSAKTRGSLTTRACCGAFSGTWITAMLQYEDSGSSGGRSGEHPASSSPARATLVPET
jgi:hypothetical protein